MKKRVKQEAKGHKERVLKREPVQIITRGTIAPPPDTGEEYRYLMSIWLNENIVGFSILEIGSLTLKIGAFLDDDRFSIFKTFYHQFLPVELIYNNENLIATVRDIITGAPISPELSEVSEKRFWSSNFALEELKTMYQLSHIPEQIRDVISSDEFLNETILQSLGGMIKYLDRLLILLKVFTLLKIERYELSEFYQTRMIMD